MTGEDPAAALLDFARSVNATQIVVGISRHKKLAGLLGGLLGGGVGTRVVRDSGDIDVHMVSHPLGGRGTGPRRQRDLGRVRVAVGFVLAVVLPVLLQLLLSLNPDQNVATAVLVQLTGSVAVALVGGLWPAILAALWSSLLVNYFSTPPVGTLTISDPQNLLALLVFVGVSAAVAVVVDLSARRSKEAARARAEATTLGDLTRGAAGAEDTLKGLLEQALDVFQVSGAALYTSAGTTGPAEGAAGWRLVAGAGETSPSRTRCPDGAKTSNRSTPRPGSSSPAGRCRPATDGCSERSASTWPRSWNASSWWPAGAKSCAWPKATPCAPPSSAPSPTTCAPPWPASNWPSEASDSPASITPPRRNRNCSPPSTNAPTGWTCWSGNLLDMSRITSESVNPLIRPVRWYEVIPAALHGIPAGRVRVELPGNMPEIDADAGMLERVIANIVENAVKYAPDSDIVIVGAAGGLSHATLARPSRGRTAHHRPRPGRPGRKRHPDVPALPAPR